MNDGGPAFPVTVVQPYKKGMWKHNLPGISVRDYAIIHLTAAWVSTLGRRYLDQGYTEAAMSEEALMRATKQADAMLTTRQASKEGK